MKAEMAMAEGSNHTVDGQERVPTAIELKALMDDLSEALSSVEKRAILAELRVSKLERLVTTAWWRRLAGLSVGVLGWVLLLLFWGLERY